jgi:hypothetical protein
MACGTIPNAAAAFFLLTLAGCAMPPSGSGVSGTSPPTVFGRLVAKRGGDADCYALVWFETENRGLMLPFDADGWFAWTLDPGDYVFSDLWCTWESTRYMGPLNVRLKVAPHTAPIYIGHLPFDYARNRFEPISWSMNEVEAAAEFARRYPGAAAAIPQEPLRDPGPGNFRTIRSICASEWGLECGHLWQGIEPLEPIKLVEPPDPAVEQHPYGPGLATLDTLVPPLKWKPATAAGMTYDVAVWEAVTYHVGPFSDVYAPGRLAVYAENIDSPQLGIPDPLKPKTKYVWSVRLRKGDRVSTWSLRGHFSLFYTRWGEWFSFETP